MLSTRETYLSPPHLRTGVLTPSNTEKPPFFRTWASSATPTPTTTTTTTTTTSADKLPSNLDAPESILINGVRYLKVSDNSPEEPNDPETEVENTGRLPADFDDSGWHVEEDPFCMVESSPIDPSQKSAKPSSRQDENDFLVSEVIDITVLESWDHAGQTFTIHRSIFDEFVWDKEDGWRFNFNGDGRTFFCTTNPEVFKAAVKYLYLRQIRTSTPEYHELFGHGRNNYIAGIDIELYSFASRHGLNNLCQMLVQHFSSIGDFDVLFRAKVIYQSLYPLHETSDWFISTIIYKLTQFTYGTRERTCMARDVREALLKTIKEIDRELKSHAPNDPVLQPEEPVQAAPTHQAWHDR